MSQPLAEISIIMPVKDTALYLTDCLSSIVNQTFRNWELIAVNDDSADNSLELLMAFSEKDERIKVYNNQNPGLLNALRLGYKHASGQLIHRMDSDDKMPQMKLEWMLEAWMKNGKGSLVTGGTSYFKDDGEVGDGFKRYDTWLRNVAKNQTHQAEMFRECVIPSNCWLVHREDFERIKGFEPNDFPEDYDLCFRFICGDLKIIGLDKVLHFWRDRDDRISRNWEVYRDNRFFELKVRYFFSFSRDESRPLVLWGAGKNGKDLAKVLLKKEPNLTWITDNSNKIGKHIYNCLICDIDCLANLKKPQIIVALASPNDQKDVASFMKKSGFLEGIDFWFFA